MSWIAGLDIIYSLQDLEFDKMANLHSLAVRLGIRKALTVSLCCYFISILAMAFAGILGDMLYPFWIAILLVGIIFLYHQLLARSKNLDKSISRLFRSNMMISPLLFLGTVISIMI